MKNLLDDTTITETQLTYNKEAGVIIDQGANALVFVEGETGHVTFPSEAILLLHKKAPGSILGFTHTHPIKMPNPSVLDMRLLENWAKVFYPFPIRLGVISVVDDNENIPLFTEKIYYARWQDKEEWLQDKSKERRVDIRLEKTEEFRNPAFSWRQWMIDFSYKKNK